MSANPSNHAGSREPATVRIAMWSARHRWPVAGLWFVATIGLFALSLNLGGINAADANAGPNDRQLEATKALDVFDAGGTNDPNEQFLVVIGGAPGATGDPAFKAAVGDLVAKLHAAGVDIDGVRTPTFDQLADPFLAPPEAGLVSPDGSTVRIVARVPGDSDRVAALLVPILPILDEARAANPNLAIHAISSTFIGDDINTLISSGLDESLRLTIPLTFIILMFAFGAIVASVVPLVLAITSLLAAFGILGIYSQVTGPVSPNATQLIVLIGLAVAVDYSLFMITRFRVERRAGRERNKAIEVSSSTAGRAVFFSGLTVLLGLLGLILFEFMILRSVGMAGALVVGIAVAAALTLQPALLSILGSRVDALAIRKVRPDPGSAGAWARLARRVMRRPLLVFFPTLALLLVLGTPFLHVRFNSPDATILPESVPSRASYETLVRNFGEGPFAPLTLAVRTDGPATDPANIARLYDYSRRLAADPRVRRVDSLVDLDPRISLAQYQLLYSSLGAPPDRYTAAALAATTKGDLTAFTVTTGYGPNRDEAQALVRDLRDPTSALAPPAGVHVLVGGGAADVSDTVSRIAADFPRTGLFIVITTYLVLFMLLRSVWLPLKAIVMNALSITAAFGALVWVFQDGNLSRLLGFQPLGFVETTLPVILFCVLFGLSMDYEVFLLTRMKEAWERTGDNAEAVAQGLERSGRIVTSAALIVVVVAGSFVFADIVLIKALGLGVALAVAIDATIVRALLVPATMRLLGKWNWWLPARLARLLRDRLPRSEAELEARYR
jgi:putative drug exporter of the RND superfamily